MRLSASINASFVRSSKLLVEQERNVEETSLSGYSRRANYGSVRWNAITSRTPRDSSTLSFLFIRSKIFFSICWKTITEEGGSTTMNSGSLNDPWLGRSTTFFEAFPMIYGSLKSQLNAWFMEFSSWWPFERNMNCVRSRFTRTFERARRDRFEICGAIHWKFKRKGIRKMQELLRLFVNVSLFYIEFLISK